MQQLAKALACFGIGLGAIEILAPATVARAAGLKGRARLVRPFGLREVASGVVILAARDPVAWLWTRVVGDALDIAALSAGMRPANPNNARAIAATLLVAPVVVLDTLAAVRRTRSMAQRVADGDIGAGRR